MLFDAHSCLLGRAPGEPPATLEIVRDFTGQRRFAATASLPAKARDAVRFSFELRAVARAAIVARDECVVAPGGQARRDVSLSPLFGRHRVTLRTEMAEPGADSFHAWAHWLKPQFM